MTDKEHADKIRFLAHELNRAMVLAADQGIKVLLEVNKIQELNTPHAYPMVVVDIVKII